MSLPERVRVVEVGPRDGLQNEAVILPTADKLAFIERLMAAGSTEIEVASFVRPDRVPQMADAAGVLAGLNEHPGVRYIVLVPNLKGLDRALAAGATAIALFTAASETFNRKNVGCTIAESLAAFREMVPHARASGCTWIRAYVSTAFVCPYEGDIAPAQVAPVVAALRDLGVDEVSVGDTLGHAVSDDVARLTERLLPILPLPQLAYHFHDTRGTALSNVERALTYGIATYDAAAGGLGGCPFAPGAAGNLATERLVARLAELGVATGIDPARIAEAGRYVRTHLAG